METHQTAIITLAVYDRDAARLHETKSCRTPDNEAGRGPWAITFTFSGRFDGVRPDELTASVQGPFIDDSGVFVTESL